MLRQEAGIAPARTDVVEAKSTRRNRRQTQRGSQYLAAAFAMGAVEDEDIGQIGLPVTLSSDALSPAYAPARRNAASRRGHVLRRSRRRTICPDHGAAGDRRKDPTAHVQLVLCKWLLPAHRLHLGVLSFRQPPISGTRELASMHAPSR